MMPTPEPFWVTVIIWAVVVVLACLLAWSNHRQRTAWLRDFTEHQRKLTAWVSAVKESEDRMRGEQTKEQD